MLKTFSVVVAVVAVGCALPGAPVLGSKCDPSKAKRECYTTESLAYCDRDAGTWGTYPCEDRCSTSNVCEPRVVLGEECPISWERSGRCSDDKTFLVTCRSGKWTNSYTCRDGGLCETKNGISGCL